MLQHKLYNCQNSSFWCWYFSPINKHCFHDFNLVNPYYGLFEIYTESKVLVVGLIISNSPRHWGFLLNFNKMFNLYKYTSFKVKKKYPFPFIQISTIRKWSNNEEDYTVSNLSSTTGQSEINRTFFYLFYFPTLNSTGFEYLYIYKSTHLNFNGI